MSARRRDAASDRTVLNAPALQAALIQLMSFVLVLAISALATSLAGIQFTVVHAAMLQSILAAALTWRRMARWWPAIQFIFPLAVIVALAAQLPPIIYLGAFLIFVALFWSTFRTQVPYFPSTSAVWSAVESLVPVNQSISLVDIGSGFGGMALRLARSRPDATIHGIELAPLPWCVSSLRARLARSRARFLYGDYHHLDFADFDLVFAYLSPAAMPDLWRKARAEMSPGALLLSNEFSIPGIKPQFSVECDDGRILYAWKL
jgi:SAM-dependent methyltransferase